LRRYGSGLTMRVTRWPERSASFKSAGFREESLALTVPSILMHEVVAIDF
jgi:hypothetical protein